MTAWNHYLVTEPRAVRLEDAEAALQAADPDFYIDGDTIVLRNGYGEDGTDELECGQISIQCVDDPMQLLDREFFEEQFTGLQNEEMLRAVLDRVRCLVSIQLINLHFWWDNDTDRTLRPLQDWLIENFEGVLWTEGGEIYGREGLIS